MRRLGRRLQSRYDYVLFQAVGEWPILLSVVGVILGAAALLPSAVSIVLGAMAFSTGLGAFLRDVRELRRRWADYEFSVIAAPFPAKSIPPPSSYPEPVYLHVPGRGTALVSGAIDRAVADGGIAARLDDEPYQLPKALKASARYVLPVRNHGRLVFNGPIIGMRGDPLPPGPAPAPPVRLHIARFFDAQCSNEMCTLRITHRETGEEFDPRHALLTGATGHLNTLAESTLADCIGISTIAVTADGVLVTVRQTSRNIASALLLAPSGSGSLEPRDLAHDSSGNNSGNGAPGTLQDIVRHGMERELCEETGIVPGEIRRTRVTGFARWLERGAKPEFLGLTELSATADDLAGRRPVASDERLYTGGIFLVDMDIAALGRELAAGEDLLSAPSMPERVRDDGSLPLLLALRAAAAATAQAATAQAAAQAAASAMPRATAGPPTAAPPTVGPSATPEGR